MPSRPRQLAFGEQLVGIGEALREAQEAVVEPGDQPLEFIGCASRMCSRASRRRPAKPKLASVTHSVTDKPVTHASVTHSVTLTRHSQRAVSGCGASGALPCKAW